MTPIAQTVLGPVPTDQLGIVDGHEHLFALATPELVNQDVDLLLDDPAKVLTDLIAFRETGGRTIAELTTIDYGRDVRVLKQLADQTGLHIIASTGFNKGVYCREHVTDRSIDELVRQMVTDVTVGVNGTRVRAGLIKFGTSLNTIHPWEEKALRAAARAHALSGAPLISHTEAGTMAPQQIELLASEGVWPDRVIICHLDRNPDVELHEALAESGAFLSYDQIPKRKYATEGPVLELLVHLARSGLHKQVILGGDFARRQYFTGWGGEPGLTYLLTQFREKLRQALEAASLEPEPIIADVFLNNPARAFAMRPAG